MTLIIEKLVLNDERNVSLTTMVQTISDKTGQYVKCPAILVLPGGGYSSCAEHEAEVVAYPYLEAGYQAFVLRYSVGRHKTWPNPLNDFEQAMSLIRENADQWHVLTNKIAVIGFSAGGHLAACAATTARNRPNAAILGYASTSAKLTAIMHPNVPAIIPTDHVDNDACPCFLFTARDDTLVPVRNTLDFEQALSDHGIMFESHIYAFGGHGFSTCSKNYWSGKVCSRAPHWVRDSIEWLEDMFGQVTPNGMKEPACQAKINGDFDPKLSARCTIGLLKNQDEAARQLLEPVLAGISKIFNPSGEHDAIMSLVVDSMPLDQAMRYLMFEETIISQTDMALKMEDKHETCRF